MQKRSKALLLVMCAIVLVVGSVFGTIAYLTDAEAVTNTFSVGSVGLKLDEADVNEDGQLLCKDGTTVYTGAEGQEIADRVKENAYHLLPGHTYIKDPTVTMTDDSEDAYVRMMVKVENLDKLKAVFTDSKYYADEVFLLQSLTSDWDSVNWKYKGFDSNTNTYEFRYKNIVPGGKDADNDVVRLEPLFKSITVPGEDVTSENIGNLADVKIIVTAHAIQAAGFEGNEDAAWTAFGNQK